MQNASDELKFKKSILNAEVTKQSINGLIISFAAIILGTILTSILKYNEITIKSLVYAQKSNPVLWIMDLMPPIFAVWGQLSGRRILFKLGTLTISQTKKEKEKTRDLIDKAMRDVIRDPLTGLPNRVLFKDHLEYALKIAGRDKSRLSVFVLDLDRFKEINNTLGHLSGDLLLKAVAARLLEVLRESDTLARFGGDEYAILLPAVNELNDLYIISNKVQKAFDPAFILDGINLDVQASAGAVMFPDHGKDAETLLKRADVAMYMAKNKNQKLVIYDPEIDEHSSYRLTLMGELKNAINDNDLMLYYQPKIDMKENRVMGAECLVRWTHKEHGIIYPDEFISVAERTGLINQLSRWVTDNALKQLIKWHKADLDMSVSVNLSARNLLDPELPDTISSLLASYKIPPEKIIFEITETAIMSDPNLALAILSRINELGIMFSIDDFGTGYSSFAYLTKLPVCEIKIDKSFVMSMLTNETNYIIVYTTIEMAHNLGLKVVAEGVESEEILAELELMGCDIAQGNLISKPISLSQLDSWFASSKWGGNIIKEL